MLPTAADPPTPALEPPRPAPPCPAVDDWIDICYVGMEARGIAASLYFIIWVVLGNFILLTLFLVSP